MAGKNVALRAEVIDLLDSQKREGESYSDVILRLAQGRRPLREVVEELRRLPPIEADDFARNVREIRLANRREKPRRARF